MKNKLIIALCLLFTMFFGLNHLANIQANNNEVSIFDGVSSYKVTKNLINQEIGYGITHIKDIAQSKTGRLNNYDSCGPKDTYVGQQVNVLTVPSNEAVRIVNWTYLTTDGWTKQTVRKLAENFEYHNPGWRVIAGVNGDFFDINGNNALPYSMNGIGVTNGDVVKPYGSTSNIGFKNDGSAYQLVGGKDCETGPLKVQVLDDINNVIKEYDVEQINSTVTNGGIGVWYSYYVMNDGIREEVTISTPTNSYYAKAPTRCLPMSKTSVYGKGTLEACPQDTSLRIGQFAIETTNEELINYINQNYTIRLQQNLVGKFEDCDNITGAGAHILENGLPVDNGASQDRHPRTVAGITADGSVILMTVDGRQFADDMYGMNYDELACALLNYGCVEAYNMDGGGSTTFITRNAYGDFDVHNSPSDGGERHDSNALLVVVPEISLSTNLVSDTSAEFSYSANKESTLSNLRLSINDQTFTTSDSTFTVKNLKPKTNYTLNYTYDIKYKNSILKDINGSVTFTTGKTKPKIYGYYYELIDDNYIIHFKIDDPEKTTAACTIKAGKTTLAIETSYTSVTIPKEKVTDPSMITINGRYDIKANPSSSVRFSYPISELQNKSISYDYDGGTPTGNNPITYNQASGLVIPDAPTKDDYDFIGWFTDKVGGEKIEYLNSIEHGDIKLYARWVKSSYSISYELDGGTNNDNNPLIYFSSNLPLILLAPTKSGHDFIGWFTDPTGGIQITTIENIQYGNLTLYARWEETKYSINYNLDDGINNEDNPKYYDLSTIPVILKDPTKEGFNFLGWYDAPTNGNNISSINTIENENITLYARWEETDYSITYILNEGINHINNPDSYNLSSLSFYLFDPTRIGYNFLGWYTEETGGEKILLIDNINHKNLTLHARWSLASYKITYDLDGGTQNNLNPVNYTINDLPIKLSNPTKDGYNFKGWLLNNEIVDTLPVKMPKDITLTATWEKIPENNKGCNCGCGCSKDLSILFSTLSLMSLAYIILRKKH